MKLYELKAIAKRLSDFSFISRARRVEDNTLELVFDKKESYFFNMTRGHSLIYKAPSQRPMQSYNAAFDALLHSLLGKFGQEAAPQDSSNPGSLDRPDKKS